jgi:HYD1 signature containing ADP-ribosyltransferase
VASKGSGQRRTRKPRRTQSDYLYHFTDRAAAYDIIRDCRLYPSHARWGFGVYFTDIAPRASNRARLSKVFGTQRFYHERLEAYVRVEHDKAGAYQHDGDPHVFIAPGEVSIAGDAFEVGFWQGGPDPDDVTGWRASVVASCAPDLDELERLLQELLP